MHAYTQSHTHATSDGTKRRGEKKTVRGGGVDCATSGAQCQSTIQSNTDRFPLLFLFILLSPSLFFFFFFARSLPCIEFVFSPVSFFASPFSSSPLHVLEGGVVTELSSLYFSPAYISLYLIRLHQQKIDNTAVLRKEHLLSLLACMCVRVCGADLKKKTCSCTVSLRRVLPFPLPPPLHTHPLSSQRPSDYNSTVTEARMRRERSG
jgi:hypothetical protein